MSSPGQSYTRERLRLDDNNAHIQATRGAGRTMSPREGTSSISRPCSSHIPTSLSPTHHPTLQTNGEQQQTTDEQRSHTRTPTSATTARPHGTVTGSRMLPHLLKSQEGILKRQKARTPCLCSKFSFRRCRYVVTTNVHDVPASPTKLT
jgi:hypothetical protein